MMSQVEANHKEKVSQKLFTLSLIQVQVYSTTSPLIQSQCIVFKYLYLNGTAWSSIHETTSLATDVSLILSVTNLNWCQIACLSKISLVWLEASIMWSFGQISANIYLHIVSGIRHSFRYKTDVCYLQLNFQVHMSNLRL